MCFITFHFCHVVWCVALLNKLYLFILFKKNMFTAIDDILHIYVYIHYTLKSQ